MIAIAFPFRLRAVRLLQVAAAVGRRNPGTPTAEGVEQLAKIWLSLRRQDLFPVTWRTILTLSAATRWREQDVPGDLLRLSFGNVTVSCNSVTIIF